MYKVSLKTKIIYALGNLGISTITVMHMLYLVYFFFPPKDSGIPYLIPQSSLFLGFTVLGILLALGRIFDAVLDPIIASFSDKFNHKLGKRIPIMRWSALPFSLCYVLVFFVPVSNSISSFNVLWLFLFLTLGAFFFTCYIIPFQALMLDIAKTSDDKVDMGTFSGACWFIGFLLVSFSPVMWNVMQTNFNLQLIDAIKYTFILTAIVGCIFLLIPTFLLNINEFNSIEILEEEKVKTFESLKNVIKDKNFKYYLVADTSYTMATYIFESGLIYFITVLAMKDASMQGQLTTIIGVLTFLCYPLVNKACKKIGKIKVLRISLLLFVLTFGVISILGKGIVSNTILIIIMILLLPFAQATFGILPHVITCDCADYDKYKNGKNRAGMYFAAKGFCTKLGVTLSTIIFTSFLVLGKDIGNDIGIRIAVIFAGGVALLGMLASKKYDEKEVLKYMEGRDE